MTDFHRSIPSSARPTGYVEFVGGKEAQTEDDPPATSENSADLAEYPISALKYDDMVMSTSYLASCLHRVSLSERGTKIPLNEPSAVVLGRPSKPAISDDMIVTSDCTVFALNFACTAAVLGLTAFDLPTTCDVAILPQFRSLLKMKTSTALEWNKVRSSNEKSARWHESHDRSIASAYATLEPPDTEDSSVFTNWLSRIQAVIKSSKAFTELENEYLGRLRRPLPLESRRCPDQHCQACSQRCSTTTPPSDTAFTGAVEHGCHVGSYSIDPVFAQRDVFACWSSSGDVVFTPGRFAIGAHAIILGPVTDRVSHAIPRSKILPSSIFPTLLCTTSELELMEGEVSSKCRKSQVLRLLLRERRQMRLHLRDLFKERWRGLSIVPSEWDTGTLLPVFTQEAEVPTGAYFQSADGGWYMAACRVHAYLQQVNTYKIRGSGDSNMSMSAEHSGSDVELSPESSAREVHAGRALASPNKQEYKDPNVATEAWDTKISDIERVMLSEHPRRPIATIEPNDYVDLTLREHAKPSKAHPQTPPELAVPISLPRPSSALSKRPRFGSPESSQGNAAMRIPKRQAREKKGNEGSKRDIDTEDTEIDVKADRRD